MKHKIVIIIDDPFQNKEMTDEARKKVMEWYDDLFSGRVVGSWVGVSGEDMIDRVREAIK